MRKRFMVLTVLAALAVPGAFAANPQYFAFSVGAMPTYSFAASNSDIQIPVGMQFQFNETFSGGFTFAPGTLSLVNVSMEPKDNILLTVGLGAVDGDVGFQVGVGYDIFSSAESFFTSLGVYIDWTASVAAGDYDINDGGALGIGLKTRFGI